MCYHFYVYKDLICNKKNLAWSLVKLVIVELDLKLLFMFAICNIVFNG
jgi:hypothetical protein